MAENREQLMGRARMLYLTGSDPSGLRFLLKNKLGLSDVEISQAYTGWNIEQQQAGYRKQAEARLAGATIGRGAEALIPREPRKISNLFGLLNRRGVAQSDAERIAQEIEIARYKAGKIAGGATKATGRFLQRTPGYARTSYQATKKGVKTAATYGEKGAGYIDTGFERAGKVSSTAVQKTPLLGGMLFGNVPRRPAPTMQSLPPAVRSAANAARIVLQKRSEGIWKEFKEKQDNLKKEADNTGGELKKLTDTMHSINQEINKEIIERHSPSGQQTEGGTAGV